MSNRSGQSERGIAILVTVLTIALGFAIVLGLAAVYLNELFIIESAKNSTAAIYAADAGIEQALFIERKSGGLVGSCPNPITSAPQQCGGGGLPSGALFTYLVSDDTTVTPGLRHVKAIGTFRATSRALEIFYPKP